MTLAAWPTYDSYKDSGVEWIGAIPSHWSIKRAGFLLDELNERSTDGSEPLLSLSKVHGVVRRDSMAERGGQAESLVGYRKVSQGDIVLNRMQAANGLLAVSKIVGITSPDYAIYRVKDGAQALPDIVSALLQQVEYQGEIKRRVKGVMEGFIRLYSEDLFRLPVICAPLPEQRAIAAFLDEKCAKVDEAVRIREEQIALLRERRQILIQLAVTRGLNPSAPMKDSGIDWIGQIPAHWEVKPLLTEAKIKSQTNRPDLQLLSVYLNLGVVKFDDVEEKRTNATSLDLSNYQVVQPGDLVLNNQQAWRGSVGVSFETGIVSPAYIVLGLSDRWDSEFANFYFRVETTVAHYLINSKGVGTIQRNLYWPKLKRSLVTIPPLEEQRAIVKHINFECGRIDSAIAIKEDQIAALKEYKTCLINAAVTGKIKVA